MAFQTAPAAIAALALLSLSATAQAEPAMVRALDPARSDLSDLRWQARPVLVFAPSPEDPRYRATLAAFETRSAALAERDVVLLTDTDPAAAGRLRAGFGAEGFRMMLVGLDGGVKMDEARPIDPDTLIATIDRMPMRRGATAGN